MKIYQKIVESEFNYDLAKQVAERVLQKEICNHSGYPKCIKCGLNYTYYKIIWADMIDINNILSTMAHKGYIGNIKSIIDNRNRSTKFMVRFWNKEVMPHQLLHII